MEHFRPRAVLVPHPALPMDPPMPAKSANERRALAHELLGLERKHAADFARMEDIKRALREIATEEGENFKEEFAGEGAVKVAGKKDGEFKGIVPELNIEAFLALSERRRATLQENGLVAMNSKYGRPFYGSVTIEVF